MPRPGLTNHLETCSVAAYSDLLVASLVTVEGFPCSLDLAGPVERCTVGVRWKVGLALAEHLGCSVDMSPLPDLDLLTTNFAESPRLNVWLEGLAESVAAPLSRACISLKEPDSAPASFDGNPRIANTGQQEEALATVPMMVCWSGLGIVAEAPRVGACE